MARRKSGCGCFTIGCVALAVVGVAVVILVAGGAGYVITHMSMNDPVRINAMAEQICQADIPPTLKPVFGADFWVIRSAIYITQEGVTPPAALYLLEVMDTPFWDSRDILVRQTASIEQAAYDGLGLTNLAIETIETRELETIPYQGTNVLTHYLRTVKLSQPGNSITIHEAVFRSDDGTVMAGYMLFNVDPTGDPGPAFIRSIRPPRPTALP